MRSTDVRTLPLSCPLPVSRALPFGGGTDRVNTLVPAETGEGLIGVGETWSEYPSLGFALNPEVVARHTVE